MKQKPFITIITPVLNGALTLARTLDSLQRQDASFEHIIYDGGSSDATLEVVGDYRGDTKPRLVQKAGCGLYESIANGLAEARGEVLAWLNADDLYADNALATVERIFREVPEIEWLSGVPSQRFERSGVTEIARFPPVYNQWAISRGLYHDSLMGYLQQESLFWRRGLYERAGGDGVLRSYHYAADYHLWRRFSGFAKLHTVRSVLASFSIRDGQLSRTKEAQYLSETGRSRRTRVKTPILRTVHNLYSVLNSGSVLRVGP